MPPAHLPLEERKKLAAKLQFQSALNSFKIQAERHGLLGQLKAKQLRAFYANIQDNFAYHLENSVASNNAQRLDEYIKALFDAYDAEAFSGKAETRSYFLRLCQPDNNCSFCSQCTSHAQAEICCGMPLSDDSAVDKGGLCIDAIKRLFRITQIIAHECLGRFFPEAAALCPEMEFCTRLGAESAQYAVDGEAKATNAKTSIALEVCVDNFERESLLAAVYIIFHEVFVHGLSSFIYAGPVTKRQNVDPNDPFSEGWMDSVAVKILDSFFLNSGPGASQFEDFLSLGLDPSACQRLMSKLSIARQNRAQAISDGAELAHTFQRKLRTFSRMHSLHKCQTTPDDDAEDALFFKFSVELNARAERFAERILFMNVVTTRLSEPLNESRIPAPIDVDPGLFDHFIKSPDELDSELFTPETKLAPSATNLLSLDQILRSFVNSGDCHWCFNSILGN